MQGDSGVLLGGEFGNAIRRDQDGEIILVIGQLLRLAVDREGGDECGLVCFAANRRIAISVGSGISARDIHFYGANTEFSPTFAGDRVYVSDYDETVHTVS